MLLAWGTQSYDFLGGQLTLEDYRSRFMQEFVERGIPKSECVWCSCVCVCVCVNACGMEGNEKKKEESFGAMS